MLNLRNFCKSAAIGGFTLLLAPFPNPLSGLVAVVAPNVASRLEAQRVRPSTEPPSFPPPAANAQAPAAPQPSVPVGASTQPAPQAPSPGTPSPGLPASLLDEPAKPAQIEFAQDTLSIHADNSSLQEILHTLAAQSGMKIDGLGHDERVFGSFGPGNPRDVISDLLNGTPYNILMVGDQSNGAPSHLILSPVNNALASAQPQPAARSANENDNEDNDAGNGNPQPLPFPAPHRPPPPPPAGTPGVKTPQALFEELQAMRQQQLQQQQQQQQQQQTPQ